MALALNAQHHDGISALHSGIKIARALHAHLLDAYRKHGAWPTDAHLHAELAHGEHVGACHPTRSNITNDEDRMPRQRA